MSARKRPLERVCFMFVCVSVSTTEENAKPKPPECVGARAAQRHSTSETRFVGVLIQFVLDFGGDANVSENYH